MMAMNLPRRPYPLVLMVLLGAVVLTGCSSSTSPPPPPGIQPEIVNITDSFEYQVQSIANYSTTSSYTWVTGVTRKSVRFMETWTQPAASRRRPRAFTWGKPPSRSRKVGAVG